MRINATSAGVILMLVCLLSVNAAEGTNTPSAKSRSYTLAPSDLVHVKVYQEDDLESKLRIGKDGTITFPLIGVVEIGGKTLDEAGALIGERLAKDYLVNPQVTLSVAEYSKRRFTVLGQVQKPGTFEIPNEESMTLHQAIAMAGGFTRLANRGAVSVSRRVGTRTIVHTIDAKSVVNGSNARPFEVVAEDTITVPERLF